MIFIAPKGHSRPVPNLYPPRPPAIYLRPGGVETYLRPDTTPPAPSTYIRPS